MNDANLKEQIQSALKAMASGDVGERARDLLQTLGYHSDRTLSGQSGTVQGFIQDFPAQNEDTQSGREFCSSVKSVRVLFQITSDDIQPRQPGLFDGLVREESPFDKGNNKSFVFAAVELKKASYPRSSYVQFTREVNKRINSPVVVLFRTEDKLTTLAFVHRRPNKRDENRDVLGSVSLIRQISTADPHRAHIDVISDLVFPNRLKWIETQGKPANFDGLLDAWLDALDTEELNRKFYLELFEWFKRAVSICSFPDDGEGKGNTERHVIRMITRLLFIWFLKEKGLMPEELFEERFAKKALRHYVSDGTEYYRTVLQNLFFATLNTEITSRGFSSKQRTTYRDFNMYRYESLLSDPQGFVSKLKAVPFVNGGLFDCLDDYEAVRSGGRRIDAFTDNIDTQGKDLKVPARLFFGHLGLFNLLHSYKFTVSENTPLDREVALDPELLGRVFENLLAAYNPETKDTARKQTGSYYTPRAVVDFMVDEALLACFLKEVKPYDGDRGWLEERLRLLLAFDQDETTALANVKQRNRQAGHLIDEPEVEQLIQVIDDLKVLDPACGSGAFPMGMLHKLVLVLSKLDPRNERWKAKQLEKTESIQDPNAREEAAKAVEMSFSEERGYGSFGRKLYLIQNVIHGVDIQPTACQIAKLRFFISLAIEQETNENQQRNYGIQPLPNLETRFVAADTLTTLPQYGDQVRFRDDEIEKLEAKLVQLRRDWFTARTRQKKLELKNEDKEVRSSLKQTLLNNKWSEDAADLVAEYDPYNQISKAGWFDAEWMFGVTEGFHIVIGNPPYVRQEGIKPPEYKKKLLERFQDATGKSDLYVYFYLRGLELLIDGGVHTFICSNGWLDRAYGAPLQNRLLKSTTSISIFHSEMKREFQTADINTIVNIMLKGAPDEYSTTRFITVKAPIDQAAVDPQSRREIVRTYAQLTAAGTQGKEYKGDKWGGKYLRAPDIYRTIMRKGEGKFVNLEDITYVRRGIMAGANNFFYLDDAAIARWGVEDEFLRPVVKSPRECKSILVDPARLVNKVFMCHKYKSELTGTNALAYIEWGESQRFHDRPSCKGRVRWWDLGEWKPPDFLWPDAYRTRFACFENHRITLASNCLFIIYNTAGGDMLAPYLNSTLIALFIETEGIENLSGVIRTDVYWLKKLPVLLDASNREGIYSTIRNRKILRIFEEVNQQDRRELDGVFFDALGLTLGEQEAVYEAIVAMVGNRQAKENSARQRR